ncbi:MAG TPA: EAL domain-containing protein [Noviherbaspirillum sp.]|jgi:EAL domain-containing protein (putative c-di-GMP-specific phosphodiesterase class I)/GGDEF domain-containing protein|uniref:EAL domain-containing protein n=1 Tax=Noviherbaspirillum sp. TaxID=1926288 RepID=UPI002F956714
MSLYRQLWITVIACMALSFIASFGISAYGARSYLEQQLAVKNADAAAALALSMSQLGKDTGTLELQAATLFEGGQYELVRVRDRGGRLLVEMHDAAPAPQLLAALLPVQPQPGRAEIADGPVVFGTVELASVRDAAYAQLQRIALQLFAGFLLAGLATGWLCTAVLQRLRRPLTAIVQQAQAIAERRFVAMPEPETPELHAVGRAMNQMVGRLHQMFLEEGRQLEQMRHAANHDGLTGLALRGFFMTRLAQALDAETGRDGGVLLLCRIRDLAGINRRAGREIGDGLLVRVARLVGARAEAAAEAQGALAGRLNGADLALLLPGETSAAGAAEALAAQAELAGLASLAGTPAVTAISAVRFESGETPAAVLARADAVLARAEAQPGNAAAAEDGIPVSGILGAREWEQRLRAAIGGGRIRLARFATRTLDGRLLHQECFVRLDLDGSGEWSAAGRFMPMVGRLGLGAEFDLAVAQAVLAQLGQDPEPLALNLSADSPGMPGFVASLLALLDRHPEVLPRLWIEIPAEAGTRHPQALTELMRGVRARGCKAGVERFGRDFAAIGSLYALGLDYIKVDAGFVREVDQSVGNQHFLKSVCAVIHGLGGMALAEGVQGEAEAAMLPALGFDGATGPAIGS